MPLHFSIRDVTFTPTTDGVRIIAETDLPCHLYCRLTTEQPWIHKKPVLRRGTWLADDVRFCFTTYEDNTQDEPGETTTHTFNKVDWNVCVTKWCYFWATISGQPCVSTSPIFEYHRVEPPPPTEFFFSYPHQQLVVTADHSWLDLLVPPFNEPLSSILPANTVGIFLHHYNAGGNERIGFRPKGSSWGRIQMVFGGQHHWTHVGVDPDIRAEAWFDRKDTQRVWLEGYVVEGGAVFFTNPLKRTPAIYNTWVEIDLSDICPGAQGILAECYSVVGGWLWGIRKHGSTDDRHLGSSHTWPIIGCDENQKVDYYTGFVADAPMELYIWGYIPAHAVFNTNAPNITPDVLDSYQTVQLPTPSSLAFVEAHAIRANIKYDLRPKDETWETYVLLTEQHGWAVVGLNEADQLEAKIEHSDLTIHLVGYGI